MTTVANGIDHHMIHRRLKIGTLEIYVEDGVARFRDRKGGRTLESVIEELMEWRRFVEDWLEKVERPPSPHSIQPEELSLAVLQMAFEWRRLGFSSERIIAALRSLKNLGGGLTEQQAETLIEEAISTL